MIKYQYFLHDFYGFWCCVENGVCGVNLILDPHRVTADQAYWPGISFNLPGTLTPQTTFVLLYL